MDRYSGMVVLWHRTWRRNREHDFRSTKRGSGGVDFWNTLYLGLADPILDSWRSHDVVPRLQNGDVSGPV